MILQKKTSRMMIRILYFGARESYVSEFEMEDRDLCSQEEDGWCPTDGQHGIIPWKYFGPQEIFSDPIARPSQRRNEKSHRQTLRREGKEKRPSQRRRMRNLPRLASIQVLSFGYFRDMLEYPRREGCDHPCREECGCFSKGQWEDTFSLAKHWVAQSTKLDHVKWLVGS